MASITVRFFGPAKDLVGESSVALDISPGDTVAHVAERLATKYERLGRALGLRLAVNRAYVALDHSLADGDEVAVIPPVSGGSGLARVLLTREPIDTDGYVKEMRRFDAGAVATFAGTVRAEAACGKQLLALDYDAYEEMAMSQLLAIRRKMIETQGVLDLAIVHRLGRLALGEVSIFVVVMSEHRESAFEACRRVVDLVKTDVPIWKKDVWSDGTSEWMDPTK